MEILLTIIALLLGFISYLLYKLCIFLDKKEKENTIRIKNYLYKIWEELHKISYLSETTEFKKNKNSILMEAGAERDDYIEAVEEEANS